MNETHVLTLERDLQAYKRAYELRGKALAEPCPHCGEIARLMPPVDIDPSLADVIEITGIPITPIKD